MKHNFPKFPKTSHVKSGAKPPKKKSVASKLSAHALIEALHEIKTNRKFWDKPKFFQKWNRIRRSLYLTTEYRNFLLEVRTRADGMCQGKKCFKKGRHVHHVVRVYDDPSRTLDCSNAVYLCVKCHHRIHAKTKENEIPKTS